MGGLSSWRVTRSRKYEVFRLREVCRKDEAVPIRRSELLEDYKIKRIVSI